MFPDFSFLGRELNNVIKLLKYLIASEKYTLYCKSDSMGNIILQRSYFLNVYLFWRKRAEEEQRERGTEDLKQALCRQQRA